MDVGADAVVVARGAVGGERRERRGGSMRSLRRISGRLNQSAERHPVPMALAVGAIRERRLE